MPRGRPSKATLAARAQGVEDQSDHPDVGPSVSHAPDPRDDLIERLAKKAYDANREYAKSHNVDLPDYPEDSAGDEEAQKDEDLSPADEAPEEVAETEDQADSQGDEADVSDDEVEPVEPDLVTIKVDGVTKQVERSKVIEEGIRALQKESSADRRLEEATRLLNDTRARFEQPPAQDVAPKQPSKDAATMAHAIQYGTEEEAAQAISELQERNRQNVATPEQIAKWVDERYQFQSAVQEFETNYPDIVKDPYLCQIAADLEAHKRANGDQRHFRAIYKEIGDEIMAWREKISAPKPFAEKQQRKAAVETVKSASVKKAEPEQPKPPTAAEIIEDMRAARG